MRRCASISLVIGAGLCTALSPILSTTAHAVELGRIHDAIDSVASSPVEGTDVEGPETETVVPPTDSPEGSTAPEIGEPETALPTGGPSSAADEPDATGTEGTEPAAAPTVSISRDGQPVSFDSLEQAFDEARDGETIEVAGDATLHRPLSIADGRALTLRSTAPATITRGEGYPVSGGKVQGMVKLSGNSSLTIESADAESAPLILDGREQDSNEAVLTVDGGAQATMGAGASVINAQASWKPWAAIYVKNGSFVLDGGRIADNFAMHNAAAAVEARGSFEMRGGVIEGNRTSYSTATIWSKGRVSITGGRIVGNSANPGASALGVVYVHGGGSLSFTGGTIGDSSVSNTCGIMIDGATFSMGGTAELVGSDRIILKGSAPIAFSEPLVSHSAERPVPIVLADAWEEGRCVATFPTPEAARGAVAYLSVRAGNQAEDVISLEVDASDPTRLNVASGDIAALFELLEQPYADNLGLELKPELTGEEALTQARAALEAHYDGIEAPEKESRFDQLEHIERQARYLEEHRDAIEGSIMGLSQLGDPAADRERTKQNFQFDNLDATGYYLEPGRVNDLYLYVDAEDPSRISLAWRQVGITDDNNFNSLNLQQRSKLGNGVNRVRIDLTNKKHGYMLYLRNDSTDNAARVRLEGADANLPDTPIITGTQLKEHPLYLHDTSDPAAFWTFVQQIREHAQAVRDGAAQDMAMLQMGDDGRAQFAITATALESAYRGISSEADAVAYIERSNAAIQERLDFFWDFDGFEKDAIEGPNAASRMRVHTAFTRTVSYPSTMYATGRYFHMPESSAKNFLSGERMYEWGMSHEYGHVLDNYVTVVNEETNNMYSIAGARNGEIIASKRDGRAFNPNKAYHGNALKAERLRDEELARMAADPDYHPDWNEGGWGRYIWAHMTAWWNGSHFFDGWDYADYDFSASPFTPEAAQEVHEYGAFGATMRILRGNAEAVRTIENTTSSIKDGTSRKYNRIAMAYTMGTGYNFAEYLQTLGQRDLSEEVLSFCAQYPSMPRKVQYYSLSVDAAELNGAQPFPADAKPVVTVSQTDNTARIEAHMPTAAQQSSAVAWELYEDGALVGFSRTGSFSREVEGEIDPGSYTVVAYDVRLNESRPGNAAEAPFDVTFPTMTVGDKDDLRIEVNGPEGATYTWTVEDESILSIGPDGSLDPKAAGSTVVEVTMHRDGKPDSGPFRFTATVDPRPVSLKVADARTYTGAGIPEAAISIEKGSLLPGDEIAKVTYSAVSADGEAADLETPGTYQLFAQVASLGTNYEVEIVPGSLTIEQDLPDASWAMLRDCDGDELAEGAWTNDAVTISPTGKRTGAGTYDLIEIDGAPFAESATIEGEGERAVELRFQVGSGEHAGATSGATETTVRIDATAPSTDVEVEQDADAREATVRISANDDPAEGVNASSGVKELHATVYDEDGEIVSERTSDGDEIEIKIEEAGSYSIKAQSVDQAGNKSEEASATVIIEEPDGETGDGGEDSGENPGDGDGQEPGSNGGGSGDQGSGNDGGSGDQAGAGSSTGKDDEARSPSSNRGGQLPTTGDERGIPSLVAMGTALASALAIALGLRLKRRS
ncbi:MAG: M60 family metallopeptidase [Collinsella sp.]|nr:M60 family metallopeptidase [Collinsella sp.]